jgi:AraC family transcriptional regulator
MNYTKILKEVTDYIEDSIEEPLTLDEIANKFYISKFHLHRIFKFYTRSTLGQYVTKRRFQFIGDEILEEKDLEIWKIALKYSYTQPQSMNRVFKKYYNCTPMQYRSLSRRVIIQEKLSILDKETISLKGKPIIDVSIDFFEKQKLYGSIYTVDYKDFSFDQDKIFEFIKNKYLEFQNKTEIETVYYISIKSDSTSKKIGIFTDKKLSFKESFVIPAGLFATLHYTGEKLYNSLDIVTTDIQSIFVKGNILPKTDLFEVIQKNYKKDILNNLIYVPIKVKEN